MAAMATWRGGRDASPRERRSPASPRGSPPVLTLSHFCARPFLSFGDVRLGASRSLPLALLNPHAEAAAVTLPRGPAAAQGFQVWPRAFELQPKEKIVISVTWTPLKEGRVREIVTFLVNGFLKHEVILLGNAEEPKKKKRSLWDTMKKKKVPASSSRRKRISNNQNINKTFSVSQKVDRVRSPLQACENWGGNEGCPPPDSHSLILGGSKIPISPISPTFSGHPGDACSPLCVRRSTANTSLHAPGSGELCESGGADTVKGFNDKVLTETSFNAINNTNGHMEEDSKLVLTPNCSSALNITQGSFLSPDSFVKNSQAAHDGPKLLSCISSDTFLKDESRPMHLESKPVHEVYQILSPDSFIKDNYGLNQEVESESVNPILSPNQFVKDKMTYMSTSQQTCKLSPLSKGNFQASESPQGPRRNEVSLGLTEGQGSGSPEAIFEEPESLEMKPNGQPTSSADGGVSVDSHHTRLKRRPILSVTVTKLKPTGTREHKPEASKPQARRCLRSVVGECEKMTDHVEENDALHSYLPVIEPVVGQPLSCQEVNPSSEAAFTAGKRKSEGPEEGAHVTITVTEQTEGHAIKRIHFSPAEPKTEIKKKTKNVTTPVSRHASHREKLNLKKKTDSLAYKTTSKTIRRTKRFVPVAQSNLTFIKPLKTDIPRHPMPFAARNMFYDERWMEKQQQGFTWWLNFVLTPDDLTVSTSVSEGKAAILLGMDGQHKLSVPRAPTKDDMSLRAYTARCRLNRLRRAACRLFTSGKMVEAIKKLEMEIEARRLAVRKDRHLWKDVGERRKVLGWLLSYSPLWLRIGLETVFGELIALEDNSDVVGMAVFILNRLLWSPDIAAEHRHPSVPHLYRDGHEEALSKFTLKKLLLLVCFLDYAKISRLIDHDPCLFCKDAEFKASKDLLLAFSRDFLSGEGDLSRHLSLLGLPVTHVQTPLDEFDFAVTNLAVDLQCGVRLVRVVELLTRNWGLSKKLRLPAISRLQKMHNVDVALQALRARGLQLQDERGAAILAKDIVDRHREKTLALLWRIALAFQVDISLNLDQLREEIAFLRDAWSRKRVAASSRCRDSFARKPADTSPGGPAARHGAGAGLLMQWVNAVCAFHGTQVENFTVSFSDGRVLCYLIHQYHPSYVPLAAICQRTTQTVECAQTGAVVLNSSSESEQSCLDMSLRALDHELASDLHWELLENEKKNFQLVRAAVSDLGGVPAMIHHSDMSNTIPDEKVVLTFLSFLCARLLDLRREARAARLIQAAWRKHRWRSESRRRQERDKAARIIQSAITKFLTRRRSEKEANAALVLQKHWRRVLGQRKLLALKKEKLEKIHSKSALVIQRYWRSYATRKKFLELKHYSVILQSRIRMKIAVASYQRCVRAAGTIQRHWRARARRREDQRRYARLRSSCLLIQAAFRRWRRRQLRSRERAVRTLQRAFRDWRARTRAREERAAAVIQSWYRMLRERRRYLRARSCVVTLQSRVRGLQARASYRRKRASVVALQRRWRAHLQGRAQRAAYLRKRAAAVRIQVAFRAVWARALRRRSRAACVLQSFWRMRRERRRFLALRGAVVLLQAHVRGLRQRRRYRQVRGAVLAVQVRFRACVLARAALASFRRARAAAIVLQAACRGWRARRTLRLALVSAVRIQVCYRAYICRRKFLRLRAAVLWVQRRFRALKVAARCREERRRLRECCVRLQAQFRMRRVRQEYLNLQKAAVAIQRHYRAHRARVHRRQELQVQRAATRLQAAYRGHRARRRLQQRALAALRIQSALRGRRERAKYWCALRAAATIQRWYRACRAARGQRTRFLQTRAAALTLQSAYRGWKVRGQVSRQHRAAATIQAAVRMARARARFQALKTAALAVQRRWRARAAGREQRARYAELRLAALTLQAAWRGRTARSWIRERHCCAVRIQAWYRMCAQRRRWEAARRAARLIQACYRAYRQRRSYLRTRAAVLALQRAFRRGRARRRAEACGKAAATIQAAYRAYRARKDLSAAQRWSRRVRAAPRQRQGFLSPQRAAARIQAAYRGLRVRRHVRRLHAAATLIKAAIKMHLSRTRYRSVRAAALVIQVRYRARRQGRAQRAQYWALLKAVHTLQAGFRGARVRQTWRRMRAAAVVIQARYRGHSARMHFGRLRAATRTVQRRYRALRAGKEQLQRYHRLRRAVVRTQAAFRGVQARRRLKVMHAAAALIQRRFRTLMTRRRFLSLRETVVWVQRKYRARVRAKRQVRLQEAVITIQAWLRGWAVRRRLQEMHRAAGVIQAALRRHRARVRSGALRCAAVPVQRRCGTAELQGGGRVRHGPAAVAAVQAARRGLRAGQPSQARPRAAGHTHSACRARRQPVFYQARWATNATQGKDGAKKEEVLEPSAPAQAAACAQAGSRDVAVGKQGREPQRAAPAAPKHIRAFRGRRRGLRWSAAVAFAHRRRRARPASHTRTALRGTEEHKGRRARPVATTLAQSHRMRWARAAHRARGPCWLSARAPVDGPQFLASPPPAPAIRAAVRAPDTTLKWENVSEEEAVATAGAAGDGQAGARSAPRLRARPSPERQRQASSRVPSSVVLIQAGTGGFLQSQRFQEMEASTFEMQGSEQRARARLRHFVEAARGHLAALRIQRAYRRHLAARAAPGRLQAAVRIQRWFRTRLQLKRLQRSHSAGNVNREEDEELRRRSWAASVIQRAARAFLSRRKQQRLQNSVIKIQALWRGHSCRKRSDCAALAAVRRNLQAIGGQAREGDKLYRRAALALHHLLTHRHLSAILEALRHLEAVTRLSPLCCERMAQSAALSKVVTLVRSCNRSVPCMDVISLALQVLLNVAKYEKTAAAVYGVERCVETLLELLQVYRGRPGDRVAGKSRAIFTRACCLLAVLLKAPSRASDVRSRPRMVDCVRGIYKLTARKHGVSPERTLCKQSKSASVSPPALPGTPAAVSRLQPGWVLRRGSLEEITEPLQAIQMVLDTLGVPCP